MKTNIIYNEDCLKGMKKLPNKSINMILADLPYGTTKCDWDSIINLDKLWSQYERVIKNDGAILLTASQPFTSQLIMSNPQLFKYEWIWEKSKASGFLNCNKMPLKAHENILVFYKNLPKYNPQKTKGKPYNKGKTLRETDVYGKQKATLVKNKDGTRFPRTVQYFKTAENDLKTFHPTQKPVSLFKYLIKTYTSKNEIVLDNVMGSGTTAVACLNTNRKFIGFEKEEKYYKESLKRIGRFDKKYYKDLPEKEQPLQQQLF